MNETQSNIYDIAYELTEYLRIESNKLVPDNNRITIYPSAWYNNFFEISIRDKNDSEEHLELNLRVLEELVLKKCNIGFAHGSLDGWRYDIDFILLDEDDDTAYTPVQIKFTKGE